ncbi:hypothetical protein [Sedimentitalea sp.]|uniref:hypothetical protein n=1 Tax=Sedimentitalea sp. TaxID=2048915 RepID=UPI003298F65A
MAEQAVAMTAQKGEPWFEGFAAYLDAGGQLKDDPDGGSASPLKNRTAEARRKKDVAVKRSQRMATAASAWQPQRWTRPVSSTSRGMAPKRRLRISIIIRRPF